MPQAIYNRAMSQTTESKQRDSRFILIARYMFALGLGIAAEWMAHMIKPLGRVLVLAAVKQRDILSFESFGLFAESLWIPF